MRNILLAIEIRLVSVKKHCHLHGYSYRKIKNHLALFFLISCRFFISNFLFSKCSYETNFKLTLCMNVEVQKAMISVTYHRMFWRKSLYVTLVFVLYSCVYTLYNRLYSLNSCCWNGINNISLFHRPFWFICAKCLFHQNTVR